MDTIKKKKIYDYSETSEYRTLLMTEKCYPQFKVVYYLKGINIWNL